MNAIIKVINKEADMYAADIEGQGEYVVFELIAINEPKVGDIISHKNFHNRGSATFKNLTQECDIDVFVQSICAYNVVREECLF